jgi:ATP-dependent Clp protease ATP-binding subunit ClpA
MTTNIGHKEASKTSVGFVSDNNERDSYKESLSNYLRPELIARIQNTLIFNPLNDDIMANIVGVEINKIKSRLASKGINLSVPRSIKNFLVKEIKSKKLNARNIKSLVVKLIQFPLASHIMDGEKNKKISLKVVDKTIKIY